VNNRIQEAESSLSPSGEETPKSGAVRSRTKTNLRVLHIITALDIGGAEMMLNKLLLASDKGRMTTVVALGPYGSMASRIAEAGARVHCLGISKSRPNPLHFVSVANLVREYRPHIIQGWMPHGNVAASLAQIVAGFSVPVVWNIRMSLENIRNEKLLTRCVIRLGRLISWHPAAIVYNSQTGAEQHEAIGYRSASRVVIPNGFDCNVFRPDKAERGRVRAELKLGDDVPLVGLVARYHPMKDHANFLRAVAVVYRTHPEARFLLVGSGPVEYRRNVSQLVDQFGLNECVLQLGERTDIASVTAALDIACSASAWGEGFSNALGEAMACAIPCVATNVGDSRFLLGETGHIVPKRDPEKLAGAICKLIEGGSEVREDLGAAARLRIQNEFALPEVARRYEGLYEKCLAMVSRDRLVDASDCI
jgi:glycosyltransferase involved in cell wall biosynthesis